MKDDYERERELRKKERLEHYEKLNKRSAFISTEHGMRNFTNDKKSYGLDQPLPAKKVSKGPNFNIMKHESEFKPSNPPK